ncbi:hypothetical protein MMC12_000972 [Toensbergia leucococca]|nr:hypothetical protein [Toensbergia leucococca]
MSLQSFFETLSPNLPDHCTPTTSFLASISSSFYICVPTPLALLSTTLGIFSILSWLFAQLPQIFKNYTLQSTAGLSIYFLIVWCLGDTTNLIGALLTKQATWQVVVAGYYVCVDVVLVSQYNWYTHFRPWREGRTPDERDEDNGRDGREPGNIIVGISTSSSTSNGSSMEDDRKDTQVISKSSIQPQEARVNAYRTRRIPSSPEEKTTERSSARTINRRQQSPPSLTPSPKTLLLVSMLCAVLVNASPLQSSPEPDLRLSAAFNAAEFIGRIFSWTSTVLYLGSRLPQIYKNYSRHSTAGLSPALFIAAFFGNLFYSTSLLTNPLAWSSYPPNGLHGWTGPEGSDRITWVSLAAPFWLGAAGVLALDCAIGVQFLMYGEGDGSGTFIEAEDAQGRMRWMEVTGWMRGWVPSPGTEELEDERPLLDREEDEGRGNPSRYGAA